MMTLLCRVGQDVEIRTTDQGMKFAHLSLAYNYGRANSEGKRPTQWIRATVWGKQAENAQRVLPKGTAVVATVRELHVAQFESGGETKHALQGTLVDFTIAQSAQQRESAPPPPAPAPPPAKPQAGFDDDDDIPF